MIFAWVSQKLLKQKAIEKLTETAYAPLPVVFYAGRFYKGGICIVNPGIGTYIAVV